MEEVEVMAQGAWLVFPHDVRIVTMGVAVLLAGCATFPRNEAGDHGNSVPHNGLELTLRPLAEPTATVGSPLVFEITLRNTSSTPIVIPQSPYLSLKWRYPNGLVDSTLPPYSDTIAEVPGEPITLAPGETFRAERTIDTDSLASSIGRLGVIEFRAAYVSELNPQAREQPLWQGTSFSNTYGVVVTEPTRP